MNLYLDRTASVVAERRLVLAERLASLGRVTQGVAHELNTPLATIRTLVADMRAALREVAHEGAERSSLAPLIADLAESSALVHDETRRLGRITQGLLTGRDLMREADPGKISIAAAVERARALVFAGVRSGIAVEVDPSVEGLMAHADGDHVVQVLVNLLQNAHDAVREQREGQVRIHAEEDEAGIHLYVEDEGVGLPEEVRARLFEPFVTTKPPGKGTGLGLYTSSMLVSAMGGRLSLVPREPCGTIAELLLPRAGARGAGESLIQLGRKAGKKTGPRPEQDAEEAAE
jgi:C4-dicarboxylate-specific signal transduction histidine kinase